MSEGARDMGSRMSAVAVVAGIGIAVCFLFLQGCSPTAAPPPPPPPATTIPTTTTVSECQTRWGWLSDDGARYDEAVAAMQRSGQEVADAVGDEALYSALGGYVLDYGPALDLWLRYEADAEALLRDCWDAFATSRTDSLRNALAEHREWWRDRRARCRAIRAATQDTPYAVDPWGVLGVSC